jgi:hypothetical protein
MQARLEPSTAPHFVRGDKVIVVTNNILLRGQPNRELRDRQLGPFTVEEHIEKHNYKLRLPTTIRAYQVFHINNLRPCSAASLRHDVPINVPKGDDDEFDVSRIFVVCITSLPGQRGKYLLFMTYFTDNDIPHV